jgi:hypothetical protein
MDEAKGEKKRSNFPGKVDGGSFKNSKMAKNRMSLADY